MWMSLPGNRLVYLARDNLAPELFERIINPRAAWRYILDNYHFNDLWQHQHYIVNIEPKPSNPFCLSRQPHGPRAKAQLLTMLQRGEVVCLNATLTLPDSLFHIDNDGQLICVEPHYFAFEGHQRVIDAFNASVSRRDYRVQGNKPRATPIKQFKGGETLAPVVEELQQTMRHTTIRSAPIAENINRQNVNQSIQALPAVETVEIDSGGKGNWNKQLNNPEANTVYNVDGNKTYQTDDKGRVCKVEADLSAMMKGRDKKDRNQYQQRKVGKSGKEGDEGGHLIASMFDGPGEKLYLVPMDSNLNRVKWKAMEMDWFKALNDKDNPASVKVKIDPLYDDDSTRPNAFFVQYRIGSDRPIRELYGNNPDGEL